MKKRWIAGMTALGVLFLLSGCQNGSAENKDNDLTESQESVEGENETTAETEAVEEPFQAAILSDTSDYHGRRILETLERVMKELGAEYLSYDCAGDQALQNQQMEEALQAGAGILFADRVETEDGYGFSFSFSAGETGDVPVVFLDMTERAWESYDEEPTEQKKSSAADENRVILASRETDTGRVLGRMAGAWLLENFETADKNGDGSISYGLYLNRLEDPVTLFRAQYSVEEADRILTEAGKPQLVYFDPDAPERFQAGTEIQVSDEMELAICSDEETAGKLIEELKVEIPVFTVGDSQQIAAWLEEGVLAGTAAFDYEVLSQAVEILAVNARDKKGLCQGMEDFPMREERCYYIPLLCKITNTQ